MLGWVRPLTCVSDAHSLFIFIAIIEVEIVQIVFKYPKCFCGIIVGQEVINEIFWCFFFFKNRICISCERMADCIIIVCL